MAHYTIYIGDTPVCNVSHSTEIAEVLSIDDIKAIEVKVRNTIKYKQYSNYYKHAFVGAGYMTIKLNL